MRFSSLDLLSSAKALCCRRPDKCVTRVGRRLTCVCGTVIRREYSIFVIDHVIILSFAILFDDSNIFSEKKEENYSKMKTYFYCFLESWHTCDSKECFA